MRYVKAKEREDFEAKAYRIYVTECLRASLGQEGNPHYKDVIERKPIETRTPEEIIDHIKDGLRNL